MAQWYGQELLAPRARPPAVVPKRTRNLCLTFRPLRTAVQFLTASVLGLIQMLLSV